jgi:predicted aldo/keto reductase-like oxidoreductase
MKEKINRREFMALVAGASAILASSYGDTKETVINAMVPKRAFGNTGVKISKLCFGGGSFTGIDGQALLDEALKRGVDCWEIVSFAPKVFGDYFKKNPGTREKVFLTGKVYSTNPAVMQEQLDKALKDNETSIIDFLALHPVADAKELTPDIRKWVEKVKKEKKIRFFGFCTHKNITTCVNDGAELGWIDGIQTVYNYRTQGSKRMEEALQKCHEKGIGIFTVKSMAFTVLPKTELQKLPLNDEKVNSLLAACHTSFQQAKLKAIWQNPYVTSICSLMPNSAILQSNILAAMDEGPLSAEIKKLLKDYADGTGRYYCGRCGSRCEGASADKIPIFDLMEMLMYSRAYDGGEAMVAKRWAQIPLEIRNQIPVSDYTLAEKICPHKMPIAQLMKEAYREFNKS